MDDSYDDEGLGQGDESISLPRATVTKLIKENLPNDIKCSNETRDFIVECLVEFVHLLSSEANEVCNKDNKKTIAPDHIMKALRQLGFDQFNKDVEAVLKQHKAEVSDKPKYTKKLDSLGISQEELLRQQQALFARARNALSASQEFQSAQSPALAATQQPPPIFTPSQSVLSASSSSVPSSSSSSSSTTTSSTD
eukprot:TRINITY_DN4530_c0_g2_i1.p1 TRINITY_DN4530_c0_g2~~TRINITY_DN4530_c0_g2_i1.p1  ORF type:complete len:208 (-),score=69.75 TRINITY_DN4530_c0_g2_i1:46-630(-)